MKRWINLAGRPKLAELSDDEALGICLVDPLLFRLLFFGDELGQETSAEQKLFMLDESERVFLCTARKIAKTVHEEAFVLQMGITDPGPNISDGMFHTPSEVHIKPVIARLWERLARDPFLAMGIKGQTQGTETILIYGHVKWFFRIEGVSGRDTNMVGLRAKYMCGDEGAFGNYTCYNSRIQTALPHCKQVWGGVPNGVRSTPFHDLDADIKSHGWSRWSDFPSFINPIYQTPETKAQLIEDYGGEDTQGYINNVLGGWGEETVSSFPPGSLAVRDLPYHIRVIHAFRSDYDLENSLPMRLNIPAVKCQKFAIGWDYGRSPDPSIMIGAYTRGENVWHTAFRINMVRAMPQPHQLLVFNYVLSHLFDGQFIGMSCDNQDAIDHLQGAQESEEKKLLYFWSNPGGSYKLETQEDPAGLRDGSQEDANLPRVMGRKGSVGNKEHYTVLIKEWSLAAAVGLVGRQLWLAEADTDLTDELTGTTEAKTLHGTTIYYPPVDAANFGKRPDHMTETLRYLCDAIERGERLELQDDTQDDALAAMGWIGGKGARTEMDRPTNWKAPWER